MPAEKEASERTLLWLLCAVQFVNVLDFVMVLPLGPDFLADLHFPSSSLGLVSGSYTAAGAVAGLLGSTIVDRFDRRHALTFTVVGLVLATAAGGLAVDLRTMIAARIAAGAFGGPATAVAMAIIADVVPVERRGRAMGTFMASFSIASVLGIPAGLEVARVAGWRATFFGVAALGALIVTLALRLLPPLRVHLERHEEGAPPPFSALLRPTAFLALAAASSSVMSNFSIAPNISAFVQFNLGAPRHYLSLMYLVGGAATFVTLRVAGKLTDRFGAARIASFAALGFALIVYLAFVRVERAIPVVPLFAAYMVGSTFRLVPVQALASRVPSQRERGRFMSLQSTVQHLSSASGAMLSSLLLKTDGHGALLGMTHVGLFAIGCSTVLPLLVYPLQARLES